MGVVRRRVPFEDYVLYTVDDMTGPPVDVKLWVNTKAGDFDELCRYKYIYLSISLSLYLLMSPQNICGPGSHAVIGYMLFL